MLALPRGGVPVGHELARALGAPLDIWIARKVGVPWDPEWGLGAVGEGGASWMRPEGAKLAQLDADQVQTAIAAARTELSDRVRRLRADRPRPDVRGRAVIVVDDGLATGGTAHAAIADLRAAGARSITLALPVAPADAAAEFADEVEHFVAVQEPEIMWAIGSWYDEFEQVDDNEVRRILTAPPTTAPPREPPVPPPDQG